MDTARGRGRGADELAVVKAAAWAWYQHGPGSDGRPMRHFNFTTRSSTPHKPSRYKLEAMKTMARDQDLPLLDNYEIQSISRQLDHLIESSKPNKKNEEKKKKKKERWKGFWGRPRVTCGARGDVVEMGPSSRRRVVAPRSPVKREAAPAVRLATCRPRTAHVAE